MRFKPLLLCMIMITLVSTLTFANDLELAQDYSIKGDVLKQDYATAELTTFNFALSDIAAEDKYSDEKVFAINSDNYKAQLVATDIISEETVLVEECSFLNMFCEDVPTSVEVVTSKLATITFPNCNEGKYYNIYRSEDFYTTQKEIIEHGELFSQVKCINNQIVFDVETFSAYTPQEITALAVGMKAYYQFNETSGTIIYNQVNNSNHGNITGTTIITGILDSARNSTGVASANRVVFNTSMMEISTVGSWNIWTKANVLGQQGILYGKWGSTQGNQTILTKIETNNKFSVSIRNSTFQYVQINTTATISLDQWYMITAVKNSTHMLIYVNGVFDNSHPMSYPVQQSNNAPMVVQAYSENYAISNYNGNVDEFSIWNRSLTAAEVSTLYNNGVALNPLTATNVISFGSNSYTADTIYNTSYIEINVSGANPLFNTTLRVYNSAGTLINTSNVANSASNSTLFNITGLLSNVYYINATEVSNSSVNYVIQRNNISIQMGTPVVTFNTPSAVSGTYSKSNSIFTNVSSVYPTVFKVTNFLYNSTGTMVNNKTYVIINNSFVNQETTIGSTGALFNGVNSKLTSTEVFNSDTVTMCAWVTPSNLSLGDIMGKKTSQNGNRSYFISEVASGALSIGLYNSTDNTGKSLSTSAGAMPLSTNTFVCGGYDGINLTLWVNGVLNKSVGYGGTITNNQVPLTIGTASTQGFYNGTMYSTYLFNRNLSAAEVFSIYNSTNGTYKYSPVESGLVYQNIYPMADTVLNNFTGLNDGRYLFNVSTTSTASVINYTETRNVTIDTINPSLNYTVTTPNSSTYLNTSSFAVNVTASDVNFNTTTIRLYNSTNLIQTNTTNVSGNYNINYSSLANGVYYFNSTTCDLALNCNTTVTRNVTVDTILPNITYNSNSAQNGTFTSNSTIFINISALDTNYLNTSVRLYNSTNLLMTNYRYDQGDYEIQYGVSTNTYYYINSTSCDLANNCNSTLTVNITIDTITPSLSYNSNSVANNSYLAKNSIFINTSSSDTNFNNTIVRLYNATALVLTNTSNSSGDFAINYTSLQDGPYYYNVTTCDLALNCNNSATRTVYLDNTFPSLVYNANTPANLTILNVSSFLINITGTDANFLNSTINLYNSTGTYSSTNTLGSGVFVVNYAALTDGDYYYNASTCDTFNNCNISLTRKITIHTIYPAISYNSNSDPSKTRTGNSIFINATVADAGLVNITLRLFNSTGSKINSTSSTSNGDFATNFTNLADGTYTYYAIAYDIGGNTNSTSNRTISLSNLLVKYNYTNLFNNSLISSYNITVLNNNYSETNMYPVSTNNITLNLSAGISYTITFTNPAYFTKSFNYVYTTNLNSSINTSQSEISYNIKEKWTNLPLNGNVSITNYCYQEQANLAPGCGGLSGGRYSFTNAVNDKDFDTYVSGTNEVLYMNYSVNTTMFSEILWRVKDAGGDANLTVTSYVNNGLLQCRVELKNTVTDTYWECYNATSLGWDRLRTYGSTARAYEESLYLKYNGSTTTNKYGTNNSIFYLDAGTYSATFYSANYYYSSDMLNVSPFQQQTNTGYIYNSQLNLTLYNTINSSVMNTPNVMVKYPDGTTSSYSGYNTVVEIPAIKAQVLNISRPGDSSLATFSFVYTMNNLSSEAYTYGVYTTNSIVFTFFDEATGASLSGTNVLLNILSTDNVYNTNSSTGRVNITGIVPGTYSISASAANYLKRSYGLTLANNSNQNLAIYLSNSSTAVTFIVKDYSSNEPIEGATVVIETSIGTNSSNWTTILVQEADLTGSISFAYDVNSAYRFTFGYTGYTTKTFILNPIIESSYTVRLKGQETASTGIFTGVRVITSPTVCHNNATNTFAVQFISPNGTLQSYGYSLYTTRFPSNITYLSGNQAQGETLTTTMFLQNLTLSDKVMINYYYTDTLQGINYTLTAGCTIIDPSANPSSLIANLGNPFGLSLFDRLLILAFFIIVSVGFAVTFGGPMAGYLISLLVLGLFVAIGFIPFWIIAIPMVLTFVLMGASNR